MPRDELDELFGCEIELGWFGEDLVDAAAKVVRPVAKVASTVLKPVFEAGKKLPVVGELVKVADAGWTQLDKTVNLTGNQGTGLLDKLGNNPKKSKAAPAVATGPASGLFSVLNTNISKALKPAVVALEQSIQKPEVSHEQPPLNIQVAPYGYSRSLANVASSMPSNSVPAMSAEITAGLEKKLGMKIDAIADVVNRLSIQNQATSEHNALMKQEKFQQAVIDSLKRISQRL